MEKRVITTPDAPAPIGPYNQAVQANGLLFISGQVAINPQTGNLVMDSIEGEPHQVMQILQPILQQAGLIFAYVVKPTIFLSDMALFSAVNEVYGSYFTSQYPARETVAVKGLPKQVNVEISMIAAS